MSATVSRKVRLVATARQKYEGRSLVPNEEFEASEQDAEDLVALNMARPASDQTLHVKRGYRRRDMKAEH